MEVRDDADIYYKSTYRGWKLYYKSKTDGSVKTTACGPEADLSREGLAKMLPDCLKIIHKHPIDFLDYLRENNDDHDGLPEFEEVNLWDKDEIEFAKKKSWNRKHDLRGSIR